MKTREEKVEIVMDLIWALFNHRQDIANVIADVLESYEERL